MLTEECPTFKSNSVLISLLNTVYARLRAQPRISAHLLGISEIRPMFHRSACILQKSEFIGTYQRNKVCDQIQHPIHPIIESDDSRGLGGGGWYSIYLWVDRQPGYSNPDPV